MKDKIISFIQKVNPCHGEGKSTEDWDYKVIVFIFSDCACCAGFRGIVYGAVISSIIWWLV